jgi:hypothetical protein
MKRSDYKYRLDLMFINNEIYDKHTNVCIFCNLNKDNKLVEEITTLWNNNQDIDEYLLNNEEYTQDEREDVVESLAAYLYNEECNIDMLAEELETIELKIHDTLRRLILTSKVKSKTHDMNVIKVDVFGYTELGIINDRLTFLDNNGLHYSVYGDCTLDDLVDIINKETNF